MTITPWDDSFKQLIQRSPQAFVDWLAPGARFSKMRREQLQERKREVDALLEVVWHDEPMLLHIEFQTRHDSTMPERLLKYNVLARSEHTLPVLSCVMNLLKEGPEQGKTLVWRIPGDREVLHFSFITVEVGEIEPKDILDVGQLGLLPLLPLTAGGATREVVDLMLQTLAKDEKLALLAYTIAALVFRRRHQQEEAQWLERNFSVMQEIFRESPVYEWIAKEGRQEGRQEERERILQGMYQDIEVMTQERFPALLPRICQNIRDIRDVSVLLRLSGKVFSVRTEEELLDYLHTLSSQHPAE